MVQQMCIKGIQKWAAPPLIGQERARNGPETLEAEPYIFVSAELSAFDAKRTPEEVPVYLIPCNPAAQHLEQCIRVLFQPPTQLVDCEEVSVAVVGD